MIFGIVMWIVFIASAGSLVWLTMTYVWEPVASIQRIFSSLGALTDMTGASMVNEELMYLQEFWATNKMIVIIYVGLWAIMVISASYNVKVIKKTVVKKKEKASKGVTWSGFDGDKGTSGDGPSSVRGKGNRDVSMEEDSGEGKTGVFVSPGEYKEDVKSVKKFKGRNGNGFRLSEKVRLNWNWTEQGVLGVGDRYVFSEYVVIPNLLQQQYRKRSVMVVDSDKNVYEKTRAEQGESTLQYVNLKKDGLDLQKVDVSLGMSVEEKIQFFEDLIDLNGVEDEEEKTMMMSLWEAVLRVDGQVSFGKLLEKIVKSTSDELVTYVYLAEDNVNVMKNWEVFDQLSKAYPDKVTKVKAKMMQIGQVFYDYRDTQVESVDDFYCRQNQEVVYVMTEDREDTYTKPLLMGYMNGFMKRLYESTGDLQVDIFWNGVDHVHVPRWVPYLTDAKSKGINWFVSVDRLDDWWEMEGEKAESVLQQFGTWVVHSSVRKSETYKVEHMIPHVGLNGYPLQEAYLSQWNVDEMILHFKGKQPLTVVDNRVKKLGALPVGEEEKGEEEKVVEKDEPKGKKEKKEREQFFMEFDTEEENDPKRDGVDIEDLLEEDSE